MTDEELDRMSALKSETRELAEHLPHDKYPLLVQALNCITALVAEVRRLGAESEEQKRAAFDAGRIEGIRYGHHR